MNSFTFHNMACKSLFLLAFLLCSFTVFSQVTTSTITGSVTDSKGESLVGATVVATHVPSGTRYGTATNAAGRFTLPAVRVGGPFTLVVTYTGFEAQTKENVYTNLGTATNVNVKLEEAGVLVEEVTILGQRSDIFSDDRTGAATNIKKDVLESLPTISRGIGDFTRLTPQSNGNNLAGRNDLYNNIAIDGSLFNNSFGLAGTVGGQTNSQPISLDAIEEIQVNLAPYDVRESGFTGGGISAVTRSGDNEFRGSIFGFFRSENFISKKVDTTTVKNLDLAQKQFGFRLGGPIIKDKLFFFVNAELDRRTDPGTTFFANRGTPGANISAVSADSLDQLQGFLSRQYQYDAGPYENYNFNTESDKILAKLDFNISQNHKLSFRYNYLKSFREIPTSNSGAAGFVRQPSSNALPFKSASYIQNNNLNSFVLELNSVFGGKFSNNFIAGLNSFRDFRESTGGIFPLVDILSGTPGGTTRTSFGYEPFTPNNVLDQDVYQFTDNFSVYLGKHTVTIGANFEYFKFANGFTPRYYGDFRFASFADFYNSTPAGTVTPIGESTGAGKPIRYELTYSAIPGVDVPLAELQVGQFGIYAQDEFQITDRFKLTGGLRVDLPFYPSELLRNPRLDTLTFAEGKKIDVSKFADPKPLYSPRIGFNYSVLDDNKLQIRGGTGLFTGRIPFVWLSNQASNNGLLFGSILQTGNLNDTIKANDYVNFPFSNDPKKYVPANASIPSTVLINSTDADFKFPQVWRSNLAFDFDIYNGYVLTLEGIYTKDVNSVYHRDLNFKPKKGQLDSPGDKRDVFNGSAASNRINPGVTNAIELTNSDEGYSYFTTIQLQKEFGNGFFASAAYTFGESKDLTSNPSAIAATAWNSNQIPNSPNDPVLSWSNYDLRHRILASASYRVELFKHVGITLAAFFNAQRGGSITSDAAAVRPPSTRYSLTYGGDLNGDGISGNDLIYIPRDRNDINLVASGNITADEQWAALDAFINQDDYLSENRGKVMQRNGGVFPWFSKVDVRAAIDLFTDLGGKKNKLQFTCDILNFGNLLNSEWGVLKTLRTQTPIQFTGYEAGTTKPKFTFDTKVKESFVVDTGLTSRWQMQLGLRYVFN